MGFRAPHNIGEHQGYHNGVVADLYEGQAGHSGEHMGLKLSGVGLVEDRAPSKCVSCERTESVESPFPGLCYCLKKSRDFNFDSELPI